MTDALSMSGLTIYFTQEEAAVRALEAARTCCSNLLTLMHRFAVS